MSRGRGGTLAPDGFSREPRATAARTVNPASVVTRVGHGSTCSLTSSCTHFEAWLQIVADGGYRARIIAASGEGVRAMTRRFAAALVVALLVALAGCSSETAAPGTPSGTATSTTASPVVVEPTSSSAASSPATSSSFVVPTPSVTDVPTPTSANPWPADLTTDQVADAQAAIAAYRGYWQTVDVATAQPSGDWAAMVSQFAGGVAQSSFLETLQQLVSRGRYTVGTTAVSPQVLSVEPGLIVINDCVDKSASDLLDLNGQSVRAPDVPGSYLRHQATGQMAELADGRWVLVLKTDDWSTTC
jgi:hypothetical protein